MITPIKTGIRKTSAAKTVTLGESAVSRAKLIGDMQVYRREVTATPETAIAFLQRAGLVTRLGRPRQLIRG